MVQSRSGRAVHYKHCTVVRYMACTCAMRRPPFGVQHESSMHISLMRVDRVRRFIRCLDCKHDYNVDAWSIIITEMGCSLLEVSCTFNSLSVCPSVSALRLPRREVNGGPVYF